MAMLMVVLQLISYLFLAYLLYFSQELGRYVIGRWIGIPENKIKIELFIFPQRVSLYNGTGWVKSREEGFLSAYYRYDPAWNFGFIFSVAGLTGESIVLILLYLILPLGGFQEQLRVAIFLSIILAVLLLFYDIIYLWRNDIIIGDFITSYVIKARYSVLLVFCHFLIRAIMLAFL